MDGDWGRDPHWSTGLSPQGLNEEQKEGEHEQERQDHEECVHPLIQGDWSNESSPRPVGLGLNEHVIQPDSLNVAGFSECGWHGVFLKSHWQWHWDLFPLHILDFGDPVCLDAHLPGPGGRGEELELPTGQENWLLLGMEREEEREWGEWEGVGRRGRNGNFYKLINFYKLKKDT